MTNELEPAAAGALRRSSDFRSEQDGLLPDGFVASKIEFVDITGSIRSRKISPKW
jgi:hypothetical protein